MRKIEVNDFRQRRQEGFAAATEEMNDPSYDLSTAIQSFMIDPAEGPFQEGYLDALLKKQRFLLGRNDE